jgi:hypothetical protein
MFIASKRAFTLIVVLLAFLVLLGAGNAGVRSAAKDTTLTGMATWPQGDSSFGERFAITGTFDGNLGYGTYFGSLTVSAGMGATCTAPPGCAPANGEITFSTKDGTFRAGVDPVGGAAFIGSSTFSQVQFVLDLSVAGGTGKYADASGHLSLTYQSAWAHFFDGSKFVFVNTVEDSGTLTGKVAT